MKKRRGHSAPAYPIRTQTQQKRALASKRPESPEDEPKIPAPNFNLAPLVSFDANQILAAAKTEYPLASLIVTLAHAFNDMKDVAWLLWVLDRCDITTLGVSAPSGQHAGMRLHAQRLYIGWLHEMLVLLWENREIVASEEFQKLVNSMTVSEREAWGVIDAVTREYKPRKDKQALGHLLEHIRSTVSYHFDRKSTFAGLEAWCQLPLAARRTDKAYLSPGIDMEGTRFYFADAAIEQTTKAALGKAALTLNALIKYIEKLNHSVNGIIRAYLDTRVNLSGPI